MNIFELATRQALRFPSARGDLTTEQLWDLPLQSKNQFDLDTVAKTVNAALKGVAEESFVSTTNNPAKNKFELMLEVVKHIISTKIKEAEDARQASALRAEYNKLRGIQADKQDEALKALTPEQIDARLKELESKVV